MCSRLLTRRTSCLLVLLAALAACTDLVRTPDDQRSGDASHGPRSLSTRAPVARAGSSAGPGGARALSLAATSNAYWLLWQNRRTGDRALWRMQGTTYNGSHVLLPHEDPAWDMAAIADLDSDGEAEVLLQNTTTGARGMWRLRGTEWNGWTGLYGENPEWDFAAVADFTGDAEPDILMQNTRTGQRGWWWMDGTRYFGWLSATTENPEWHMAGAGDFTGDGKADVLFENRATGARGIWEMDGVRWRAWHSLTTEDPSWRIAAVHDANGDGSADVLFQHQVSGARGWWIMNRLRWTGWMPLATVVPEWEIVGAFNHGAPGAFTVAATYDAAKHRVSLAWSGTGAGSFRVDRTSLASGTTVTLATLQSTATSYVDDTYPLETAGSFRYTVTACPSASTLCTSGSAEVATAALPAPTGVVATATGYATVTLSWNDVANETGYEVKKERGTSCCDQFFPAANTTSLVDRAALPASTYGYRVYARVDGRRSAASALAEAAVPDPTTAAPGVATDSVRPEIVGWMSPDTGLVMFGTLNANGGQDTHQYEAWFEYGQSPTLSDGQRVSLRSPDLQARRPGAPEVLRVSGASGSLSTRSGATYYYRLVARNTRGTTSGTIRSYVFP